MIQNLLDYQEKCKRTLVDLGSKEKNREHMHLGMVTEVGEIADIFKKKLAYGKEIDIVNLKEEIGDLMWYIANACSFESHSLEYYEAINYIESKGNRIDQFLASCFNYSRSDFNGKVRIDALEKLIDLTSSLCEDFELDIYECLDINIRKLQKRYPEKFTNELALNRDLDAERKEIEK